MTQETLSDALPHSAEAERSVLGAILVDNQQFERAREILTSRSFYARRNQQVFEVLQKLVDAGTALDVVTVKAELEREGLLEEIGGPAYLAELLEGVPRSVNVEHYARIVKEKDMLRELIRCTQGILASALEARDTTDQLLDDAEKVVRGLKLFRHRKHEVIVFHVLDPFEVNFPFENEVILKDMETGEEVPAVPWDIRREYRSQVASWISRYRSVLRQSGIDYVPINTETTFDVALFSYLEKRQRMG